MTDTWRFGKEQSQIKKMHEIKFSDFIRFGNPGWNESFLLIDIIADWNLQSSDKSIVCCGGGVKLIYERSIFCSLPSACRAFNFFLYLPLFLAVTSLRLPPSAKSSSEGERKSHLKLAAAEVSRLPTTGKLDHASSAKTEFSLTNTILHICALLSTL